MNINARALCLIALLGSSLAAQESMFPALPRGSVPRNDADADGIPDEQDKEPFLSNFSERFVFRIESPTLTWQLEQTQSTSEDRISEQQTAEIEKALHAAQDALEDSNRNTELVVDEKLEPVSGWMQMSVNPMSLLSSFLVGVGMLDAMTSGITFNGSESKHKEENSKEKSILRRVAREESTTREKIVERRSSLLQIQRHIRILRNPKLQISLHLRNGGDEPLTIERPEVPVLAGDRMLGVALPVDTRDRDRVVIPPGRTQAILLSVAVDDTEFWDSLTKDASSIRYEPLLGAMRAHFRNAPETDLLSLAREAPVRCMPAVLSLPDGVRIERSVARPAPGAEGVSVQQVLDAWNQSWRRQHPESDIDLIRTDSTGQVVSAAGRTGSPFANGWQIVVDGEPLALNASTDRTIRQSLEVRWARLEPLFRAMAQNPADAPKPEQRTATWAHAGLTAWQERDSLLRLMSPQQVIQSLQPLLQGLDDKNRSLEHCGPLFATLGEAFWLAGSKDEALRQWQRGARYGDPQSILSLANHSLQDPEQAADGINQLRVAASAGSAEAMTRLSDFEQQPGGNPRRGMLLLGQAAESGYGPALTELAQRYESGDGLPRDVAQAAQLYRKAAAEGDSVATLRLGMLYETGQGVRRDPVYASELYAIAARGERVPEVTR